MKNSVAIVVRESPVELKFNGRNLGQFTRGELADLRTAIDEFCRWPDATVSRYLDTVCDHFNVARTALFSSTRGRVGVSDARLVAMALAATAMPGMRDDVMASVLERCRTQVVHARGWLADRESSDPKFAAVVADLRAKLKKLFPPKP